MRILQLTMLVTITACTYVGPPNAYHFEKKDEGEDRSSRVGGGAFDHTDAVSLTEIEPSSSGMEAPKTDNEQPEKAASGEGSDDDPGEGSDDDPGEGSDDDPGEGSDDDPGEGSGDDPGEGSDDDPGEGSDDDPGEGSGSGFGSGFDGFGKGAGIDPSDLEGANGGGFSPDCKSSSCGDPSGRNRIDTGDLPGNIDVQDIR